MFRQRRRLCRSPAARAPALLRAAGRIACSPASAMAFAASAPPAFSGSGREAATLVVAGGLAAMLAAALVALAVMRRRGRGIAAQPASEERFRLLYESARDPILLLRSDGRFVDGNDAAVRAFGVSSVDHVMGRDLADFSPERQPDGRPSSARAEEMIRAAFAKGSTQFEWTHRRADGSEFVADITLTVVPMAPTEVLMAHLRDVTDLKRAQAALTRRLQLEELIIRASTRFINLDLSQVDQEIDAALRELGQFAGADRAYVFQFREDEEIMDCTHEWCREGVSVEIHRLQGLPFSAFPWFMERTQRREVVLVPRVRDLPPEARLEREEFERESIESLICVPMVLGDRAVGFVGFDSVTAEDAWTEETVTLLRVAADVITGALARKRADQALRESQEHYRGLVETTSDWIWEVDAHGVYTYASPKVSELLGYEPSEVVGRTPFDLMPPEEATRVAEAIRPHFERCEPFSHLEILKLHKDGRQVVLDTSGVPVFDGHREFCGFRGVARDITEQKRAAEALRESEELFRTLFEQAMDGLALADLETQQISRPNPQMCRLLGYSPGELQRLSVSDLHPTEDLPWVMETFARQARGEIETPVEMPVRRKDGTVFYADVSAKPVMVGGRKCLLGVFRDVTARRQAEEALRQSEQRLRALFAAMTDVILVFDSRGRCLEVAPTKPDLLYKPAEEVLGKTLHEIFPAAQADSFLDHVRRALDTGQTVPLEYSLPIGGEEVRFSAAISPLSRDTVLVVARDITAQVEQYERLLAAERGRASLAEHLTEEINHRARNNLAMVSGLLQMQALQTAHSELASALREAVARIRTFVDIHEKIYATGAEQVDLLAVLRQVTDTLGSVFAGLGAVISVEGTRLTCPTRAATNLAVITNELITNALKYGGPGADGQFRVEVELARREGRVAVSVRNSGPPVPEGFDVTVHTGMGLRLVTEMAEQHGGSFALRPTEEGSVAELTVTEESLRL